MFLGGDSFVVQNVTAIKNRTTPNFFVFFFQKKTLFFCFFETWKRTSFYIWLEQTRKCFFFSLHKFSFPRGCKIFWQNVRNFPIFIKYGKTNFQHEIQRDVWKEAFRLEKSYYLSLNSGKIRKLPEKTSNNWLINY